VSGIAVIALLVSLLSLALFFVSNYKSLITNAAQYLLSPKLEIRLLSGSVTSEDGTVTVGGSPDDFDQNLIQLQKGQNPAEIDIENIRHPDDHPDFDHFDISVINDDVRPYLGSLTIVADSIIANSAERHPELQKIASGIRDFDKQMTSAREIFKSHTLGIKQEYKFEDMYIADDGRANSSWFINRDMISPESDEITSHEITAEFEPILDSSDFPWWIPKYIDEIRLESIEKTFIIANEQE
jgi:hypothetical protein